MLRVLLLIACLLAPSAAFAKGEGVDSRGKFSPDDMQVSCGNSVTGEEAGCHFTDANPELMVTIEGPAQLAVGPEGVKIYTASISAGPANPCQDPPLLAGAGINVALDAPNAPGCVLEPFAPVGKIGTQNDTFDQSDYVLSHAGNDTPPSNLNDEWSYQFLLSCLAPGTVSLRVAMNAFDGNGAEDCEIWNSSKRDITVPEPGNFALGSAAAGALAAIARSRIRA